ncbi:MAG: 6-phosphofructokinase [Clostridia bacterium]|nr:6-phosphofructokinase [Clostridia bacterium]
MKNLLVAQSGGPTAAINASLAGVISKAKEKKEIDKIYGALNGIEGIFNERILELSNLDLKLLKQTPSAYLGSCRKKLPDIAKDEQTYQDIFSYFAKHNIGYFIYIGGNDSMDTVCKLSDYATEHHLDVKIIGVPKTIDNDLANTDHTPGFGSAAKYVATTVSEITEDSLVYDLKSVTIVEIMGRHAGWLTAAAALARNEHRAAPQLIYLPEVDFSKEQFIKDVKDQFQRGVNHIIIAVSEGIHDENGTLICEGEASAADSFGHAMLSGAGKVLENLVKKEIGCKARSVELNVCQRCAGHLLSETDIAEAFLIGEMGVEAAISGKTGEMMVFTRVSDAPYTIRVESADIHGSANVEKRVPKEWIINGNDITSDLITYLRPLISGQTPILFRQDGLPEYLYR